MLCCLVLPALGNNITEREANILILFIVIITIIINITTVVIVIDHHLIPLSI